MFIFFHLCFAPTNMEDAENIHGLHSCHVQEAAVSSFQYSSGKVALNLWKPCSPDLSSTRSLYMADVILKILQRVSSLLPLGECFLDSRS